MLDVAACNSFVLFSFNNIELLTLNFKRQRRLFLQDLAINLIRPLIEKRAQSASNILFYGYHNSFKNLVFFL